MQRPEPEERPGEGMAAWDALPGCSWDEYYQRQGARIVNPCKDCGRDLRRPSVGPAYVDHKGKWWLPGDLVCGECYRERKLTEVGFVA